MHQNQLNEQARRNLIKATGRKTDVRSLIDHMLVSGGDSVELVRDRHAELYSGGFPEAEYDRLLFSPSTTDIRTLPPAILDTKEALVPVDLIPMTKEGLRFFLTRLMVATGRKANTDILVAGWSTGQSPHHDFNRHVDQLWDLQSDEPAFYAALVGGRFGSVIRHVQQGQATTGKTRRLRDLLVAQALIWCAHDVQMVIARLTKKPEYGDLLPRGRSLEGSLNDLRKRRVALDTVLDLFFGSRDWRVRDIEPVCSNRNISLTEHSDPIVRRIAKQVVRGDGKAEAKPSASDVTAMTQQVAASLRTDPFLTRTATPRTMNAEAKAYPTDWYGLPPMAAASVSIRRLIQAEHQLPAMIDAVIAGAAATSIQRPLPAYRDVKPKYLTTKRLEELLHFYRDAIWAENDSTSWAQWKATGGSCDFLAHRGLRRLNDHHGPAGDPRRAFYLLDILPEHRFAVG